MLIACLAFLHLFHIFPSCCWLCLVAGSRGLPGLASTSQLKPRVIQAASLYSRVAGKGRVGECTVILYTHSAKGRKSSHFDKFFLPTFCQPAVSAFCLKVYLVVVRGGPGILGIQAPQRLVPEDVNEIWLPVSNDPSRESIEFL